MTAQPSNSYATTILSTLTAGPVYLALYTSDPTPADIGTEVTGGTYTRKSVTFNLTTATQVKNTTDTVFSGLPAATITHYGLHTASTGGTLLVSGLLANAVYAASGDEITFAANDIVINVAGA